MKTFGKGANFGLAMVDIEKNELQVKPEVPIEINNLIQFLTGESD